jgi:hypothetical protein
LVNDPHSLPVAFDLALRVGFSRFARQQFCDYCLESLGERKEVVRGVLDGFTKLQ